MSALEEVLVLSAKTQEALLAALHRGKSALDPDGRFRLALVNPSEERLARAAKIVAKAKPCQGIQDIWYSPEGLLFNGGKLAFMYPGIDSLAKPELSDVAAYFQLPLRESGCDSSLENRGADVFYTSDLYTKILRKLAIHPDLIFGHSLGEWSGVVASGLTGEDTVDEVVATLQPGMLPVPGVVFVAVGCGVERSREAIQGLSAIEVSHDNCPHQSILCGIDESADIAIARLSEQRIICHKLDFRSGFHTSLFKDYIGPLEQSIGAISFKKPKFTLWSATTCRPYPDDAEALRSLMLEHLLKPVRFRELTKTLYDEGARVFLQVGSGSLPGFINDSLRGLPHLALSTATPKRSGLAQLQRLCLALFVEGAHFKLDALHEEFRECAVPAAPLPPVRASVPVPQPIAADLFAELQACFADIQKATQEVAAAMQWVQPFHRTSTHSLSLAERPELMDHCFYKQKKAWKNVADLFPVMPMTASLDLIMKVAQDTFPERKIVALESILATKWLSVEKSRSIDLEMDYDGRQRLKVAIVGHFSATVIFDHAYQKAPASTWKALSNSRPSAIPVDRAYSDGWLFHGKSYQCLTSLQEVGDEGIVGSIRSSSIPGALLDNVGQLAGIWAMQSLPCDRYVMPIRIRRIAFYQTQPMQGEVICKVRCDRVRTRDIMFQMELSHEGQIWATIEGWEKWRFETDELHWQFLLKPGRSVLSVQKEGFTYFDRQEMSESVCDDLSMRYLREAERNVYQSLGRKRRSWICGRIAAKDAVRNYLWRHGYPHEIFPGEIWIENDAAGKPIITELPGGTLLNVSISHKEGLGVASVSPKTGVGIDIERIEPREASFEKTVFTAREMAILPEQDRAEWITRFWGAKEAFAKSTGLGMQGNPRRFAIEEIQAERLRIAETWVRTLKLGSYIISQNEGSSDAAYK